MSDLERTIEAVINFLGQREVLPSHHEMPSQQEIVEAVRIALDTPKKHGVLDVEMAFFNEHRKTWLITHKGEWALVKDKAILGFFPTQRQAVDAGYAKLGNVPFLTHQVVDVDPVHRMPNLSGFGKIRKCLCGGSKKVCGCPVRPIVGSSLGAHDPCGRLDRCPNPAPCPECAS